MTRKDVKVSTFGYFNVMFRHMSGGTDEIRERQSW